MEQMTWADALWIGLFQAISIFPGISRSGASIAGGMTRNLERPAAARFSFLMSIPILAGAGAVALVDLLQLPALGKSLGVFLPGFAVAAVVGYFSIRWLLGFLTHRSLVPFSLYCVFLAALILGMHWAGI
jgi:undecaprenyl-diphosphatase